MKIEEHLQRLRTNRKLRGAFKERRQYSRTEKKCSKKTFDFFSNFDLFGETVSLTFKGKQTYTTLPGIFMSSLLLLLIVSFAAYQFYQMIFRLNPAISELTLIRDFNIEPEYQPYLNSFGDSNGGFDFAFGTFTKLDPTIAYFEVNQVFAYFSDTLKDDFGEPLRIKRKVPIEFKQCGQETFNYPDANEIDKFNINQLHCLTKSSNYTLKGDFFSEDYQYLEVKLKKCSGKQCKNSTEIDRHVQNLQFQLVIINAYLDFNDYNDPIKRYVDDIHFFEIEHDRHKRANIFIMKGEVSLEDSLFQIGHSRDGNFALVENTRTYEDSLTDETLATLYFRIDANYYSYTRDVYTVLEFMGDIGGLQSALYSVGYLLISFLTKRLFLSSLMREMYHTELLEEEEEKETSLPLPSSQKNERNFSSDKGQLKAVYSLATKRDYNDRKQTPTMTLKDEENVRKSHIPRWVSKKQENDITKNININAQKDQEEPQKLEEINQDNIQPPDQITISKQPGITGYFSDKTKQITANEQNLTQLQLRDGDVESLFKTIIKRRQFKYQAKQNLKYFAKCLCLRSINKESRSNRTHFLFEKCEDKLNHEFDIIHLMKQSRATQLLQQVLINQKQKTLLRFQKRHVVETDSSSDDSDDDPKLDTVNLLDNKNPKVLLGVYSRMKKLVDSYKFKELGEIDQRIIKGIFFRKNRDFDEELIKTQQTLFQRLMNKKQQLSSNTQNLAGILSLLKVDKLEENQQPSAAQQDVDNNQSSTQRSQTTQKQQNMVPFNQSQSSRVSIKADTSNLIDQKTNSSQFLKGGKHGDNRPFNFKF